MTIQQCFDALRSSDAQLTATMLATLSGLGPEEMQEFKDAWADAAPERRAKTIAQLIDLAEDNVELEFSCVYRYALEDDEAEVRASAIPGLWECEERSLLTPLIRMAQFDSAEDVRAAAAQGLGRFALLAETGRLIKRDARRITDTLLSIIGNDEEEWNVRRRAIESIAAMSLPEVEQIIRDAYAHSDDLVKGSALFAMGRTCNAKWLPTLLAGIDSRVPELRYESVVALGELGEQEAVTYIIPLIADGDAQVQEAAIHSLGKIGGAIARKALEQAMRSQDAGIADLAQDSFELAQAKDDPLGEYDRRRN